MIFWLILIILAIIVLAILWWYSGAPGTKDDYPTMHARCKDGTKCGGDLICDNNCHRCKKRKGGACAGDVDCESGLICNNWICTSSEDVTIINDKNSKSNSSIEIKDKKGVRWDESRNQIFEF